jgi:hypothetical protein
VSSTRSNNDEELIEALQLLSAAPDQLIEAFPEWVEIPDEIALNYDAAYSRFSEQLPLHTVDWNVVRDELLQLNSLLRNPAPDEVDQWSTLSLWNSEGWRGIRRLATDILLIMGIPLQRPRPQHDRYAKGG